MSIGYKKNVLLRQKLVMMSFLDLQMAVRQTACHAWTNSLSCLDQQLFMHGPTACHARTNSLSCLDQQLDMPGLTGCHALTNSLSCLDKQLAMPGPTACHALTNSESCLGQQQEMTSSPNQHRAVTSNLHGTTAGNDIIPGYPMVVTSQAAEVTSSAYQLAMMSQLPAVYYLFSSGPIQTTSWKLLHTP